MVAYRALSAMTLTASVMQRWRKSTSFATVAKIPCQYRVTEVFVSTTKLYRRQLCPTSGVRPSRGLLRRLVLLVQQKSTRYPPSRTNLTIAQLLGELNIEEQHRLSEILRSCSKARRIY